MEATGWQAHSVRRLGATLLLHEPCILDRSELAAWMTVASVILNLDETITKQ